MTYLSRKSVGLALVAALIASPVVSVPTAAAADPCAADQYGWTAQRKSPPSGHSMNGISGSIEAQVLDLCAGNPPPGNFRTSWMWVAIEGDQSNTIMQIGTGRTANTETMGWWRAWGRDHNSAGCEGFSDVSPGGTRISNWSGSTAPYNVRLEGNTWEFRINGVVRFSVSAASICWDGIYADWFAETVNSPNSSLGGSLANPLTVIADQYRSTQDANWHSPAWTYPTDCTIQNPSPPYLCKKYDSDKVKYWSEF